METATSFMNNRTPSYVQLSGNNAVVDNKRQSQSKSSFKD